MPRIKKHSKRLRVLRELQKFQQDMTQPENLEKARMVIMDSLQNPSYRMRTIRGISKDTFLTPGNIVVAIQNDPVLQNEVKVLSRKSKEGLQLFMSRNRYLKESSWLDRFVDIFSSDRASGISVGVDIQT